MKIPLRSGWIAKRIATNVLIMTSYRDRKPDVEKWYANNPHAAMNSKIIAIEIFEKEPSNGTRG